MESRIHREVYVRFEGEPTRNLLRRRSKVRGGLSHYDSAEGLLTAVVLLLAEYLPPQNTGNTETRHIVSVFKLVQDLLAPSKIAKGKNGF